MNKTLKTIGWILVALGILGILADAGAFVLGHRLEFNRAAAIQQWKDSDGQKKLYPSETGQRSFTPRDGSRMGFARRPGFGFIGLPILLLALGPVLAVIGAVILLVNRPPREKIETAGEKETSKEMPKAVGEKKKSKTKADK